jgi:NOL1/NOP2/fmu family ribosome biogenesis protein
MAAVEILAPQPGECVLDLAAAPGGKSTHLIARMGDQGLLVANEIHPQRAWDLAENLERWGAARAVITNETPQRLAERLGAAFDRVLLDAPCSGEGMFRKSPASRAEWSPGQVLACARRQADILEQAAALVRPGGWLAYTTCTFAPEEDEALVGRFLERRADFEIAAIPPQAGFTPARPDWLPADPPAGLQSAVRLWPHRAPGEGHFIALLRRRGGEEAPRPRARRPARRAVPAQAARLFEDFRRQALPGAQFAGELALRGSYLYALPETAIDLDGLRCLHPGRWLGVIKKDRFEPAHALALSVRSQAAAGGLDLDAHDPRLARYLQGETIEAPGRAGWALVSVDGYSLGWGKRVQEQLKSRYPRGLRRPG